MANDQLPLITPDWLASRIWRYSREGGQTASEAFQLRPDGTIAGYAHDNEASWRLQDGCVELLSNKGKVTVRFDRLETVDGMLVMSGAYSPTITLCLTELSPEWLAANPARWLTNPGTRGALADQIKRYGWDIGEHSYGVPGLIELGAASLTIGRYCSIAAGVKICFADHRTDTVSSYPFKALSQFWPSVPGDIDDHVTKGDVVIGSDVWMGQDVMITSGVTIGHGAVLGARSVVTRDVPPYAIVAGTPAKMIRYRFPEHVREALLRIRWWDWPAAVVDAHLPLIMSGDVLGFVEAAERVGGNVGEGVAG